ncbi:MAG: protein arginine kinase [Verrucomicrobia bacterium]|nr:protein arginine kinase [Verrucomicrobiota bacterium]
MDFPSLHRNPAEWMVQSGPHGDIVVTSRVRLARNVEGLAFPGWTRKNDRAAVLQGLRPVIEALPEMAGAFSRELKDLDALRKQLLVERHLISREHAAKSAGSAAIMNPRQTISIMINEEDHLRMQAILPGLQLHEAWAVIDGVDSGVEKSVNYAFNAEWGYLTACPTNLGTGMRASAMLHLPGLVLGDQMNEVVRAVNKIGLAVRGLYGEGSEAFANLFQMSNQSTLGESEQDIIARLEKVILHVVEQEKNARQRLVSQKPHVLDDQICRAWAILNHARVLGSKEALNLLSMLRLGIDLGYFPGEARNLTDTLMMEIQPAHLQTLISRRMDGDERDRQRAEILRRRLKNVPPPGIGSGEDPGGACN